MRRLRLMDECRILHACCPGIAHHDVTVLALDLFVRLKTIQEATLSELVAMIWCWQTSCESVRVKKADSGAVRRCACGTPILGGARYSTTSAAPLPAWHSMLAATSSQLPLGTR